MKTKKLLSIIIVNFNTAELTKACILSLVISKHVDWEVIVVDNGSTDNSSVELEAFIQSLETENIRLIHQLQNGGFSKGNNIGIGVASGEYILLLNSDTEVKSGAIEKTLSVFTDPRVGAATCKLVLSNGDIDPACHRGFPTPWAAVTYFFGLEKIFSHSRLFSGYHQWYKDLHTIHEIDSPSGAFFLVRKSVIDQIGMLDEDYFMYGEDLDWAYRIKESGYKIMYVPHGEVLHIKKQSGRQNINPSLKKKTNIYFYETMILFYKKHYVTIYPSLITFCIFLLLRIRILVVKIIGA